MAARTSPSSWASPSSRDNHFLRRRLLTLAALVFALVLILTTFMLGAIAVRVMGETGIEPVSGTSFIVLLMLLGVFLNFQDLRLNTQDAVLLGLGGTTVFGSAISMAGTVIGDYKNSLYIGNRPYISKGNIMGVVPGAIIGAGVAIFLSIQLAEGRIQLIAPQANAFATFSVIFAEGQGDLVLLALGFLLGMFVEWATGMGTSFGLGMYLDVPHVADADWWCCSRPLGGQETPTHRRPQGKRRRRLQKNNALFCSAPSWWRLVYSQVKPSLALNRASCRSSIRYGTTMKASRPYGD